MYGKPEVCKTFWEEDIQYITQVHNLLHSLVKNSKVCLNQQQVQNRKVFYENIVLISKDTNASARSFEGILAFHG